MSGESEARSLPVPKAKHFLLLVFDALQEFGDVLYCSDPFKHAQDSLVGPSVQRAIQGSDGTRHSSVHINPTGG